MLQVEHSWFRAPKLGGNNWNMDLIQFRGFQTVHKYFAAEVRIWILWERIGQDISLSLQPTIKILFFS